MSVGAEEMSNAQGPCNRCHEMNLYKNTVCNGCGARLPWADALDESRRDAKAAQAATLLIAQQQAEAAKQAQLQAKNSQDSDIYKDGDGPSFLAAVLGFLFPPGGLFIFLAQQEQFPERAASAGKGALLGLFFGIVVCVVFWLGLISYSVNFR